MTDSNWDAFNAVTNMAQTALANGSQDGPDFAAAAIAHLAAEDVVAAVIEAIYNIAGCPEWLTQSEDFRMRTFEYMVVFGKRLRELAAEAGVGDV